MKKDVGLRVSLPIAFPERDEGLGDFISNALRMVKEYHATEALGYLPSKGHRLTGFPSMEYIESCAIRFKKAKEELAKHGVELAAYFTLTVKSGKSDDFGSIVRADGSQAPFSSCVLDENFKKALSKTLALFISIAKPKYLLLEDDFSVSASSNKGCFCPLHLKEFSKKVGKEYDRESLLKLFNGNTKKGLALYKKWRSFMGETLIEMAKAIREEVDILSPEIPIGCNQTGADELDGYSMPNIAKALAGNRHKPICRPRGTFYCGGDSKDIPCVMFNAMKVSQNYKGKITMLHESDAYPHNRFYTGAGQMDVISSAAISYGEDGLLLFAEGFSGGRAGQESSYGKSFAKQRKRLNTIRKMVKNCSIEGVELGYDWFYNKLKNNNPLWCRLLGLFGIPTTSQKSQVAFWDDSQVNFYNDKTIKEYLSKTLFLDGDAAKRLIERGYEKYLGVKVADRVDVPPLTYDLSIKDVISAEFSSCGDKEKMPCGHSYCPSGNAVTYRLVPTDNQCKVITSYYDRMDNKICDTATFYKNSLGGKVIVFGQTLYGQICQSWYNYTRQNLVQRLIQITCDKYITCTDQPNIWLIVNKPNRAKNFKRLITISNLGLDQVESYTLRVPSSLGKINGVQVLGKNGIWKKANCTINGENLTFNLPLGSLGIEYVKII
ncbi:MAG: hypothetical protein II988_06165 [Clostridia bacterium]|nr:hypothetical protein [Clostridia bacterium]